MAVVQGKIDTTDDKYRPLEVTESGDLKVTAVNALVTEAHDSIALTYDGTKLSTVVFKLSGATVATLTLTYSGTQLTGVTKT